MSRAATLCLQPPRQCKKKQLLRVGSLPIPRCDSLSELERGNRLAEFVNFANTCAAEENPVLQDSVCGLSCAMRAPSTRCRLPARPATRVRSHARTRRTMNFVNFRGALARTRAPARTCRCQLCQLPARGSIVVRPADRSRPSKINKRLQSVTYRRTLRVHGVNPAGTPHLASRYQSLSTVFGAKSLLLPSLTSPSRHAVNFGACPERNST
jgi:hypothetical protein